LGTTILFDEMGVRISNPIPVIMLISTELICLEYSSLIEMSTIQKPFTEY
jgi:hypothetical protein